MTDQKTLTIPVDDESYDKGYSDGHTACATPPVLYMGHTAYYWQSLAESFIPLAIAIIFILLLLRAAKKRQKEFSVKNDLIIERQMAALEAMKKTNELLAEISQKLDKK